MCNNVPARSQRSLVFTWVQRSGSIRLDPPDRNDGWIQQEASDRNACEGQSDHSVTPQSAADDKSACLVVLLFVFSSLVPPLVFIRYQIRVAYAALSAGVLTASFKVTTQHFFFYFGEFSLFLILLKG